MCTLNPEMCLPRMFSSNRLLKSTKSQLLKARKPQLLKLKTERPHARTERDRASTCKNLSASSRSSGVQKELAAASGPRKTLAMALISISAKYMDSKRVSEGRDLASSRKKQPLLVAAKEWLVATVVMSLLPPLHLIAKALVFKKIRATLTMGKCISGGGSLPPYVDKFFEMIGIPLLNGYGLTETSPVLTCRLPHNNKRWKYLFQ